MIIEIKGEHKSYSSSRRRSVWNPIEYIADVRDIRLCRYNSENYWAYLKSQHHGGDKMEIKVTKEEYKRLKKILLNTPAPIDNPDSERHVDNSIDDLEI